MSNLDLRIIEIMKGDTPVEFILKNEEVIYPDNDAIEFEDKNVELLCLSANWGSNGQITKWEAALVTSLNGVFYGNSTITKFNELKYFIGLTSLYRQNENSYAAGEFYNCTSLSEITLPKAPIDNLAGAFRGCSSLTEVDFSPITGTKLQLGSIVRACTNLVSLTIKGGTYQTTAGGTTTLTYSFYNCLKLREIIIDGVADWSKVTNINSNCFYKCEDLADIRGEITGLGTRLSAGVGLNLSYCKSLTRESLLVILNGLSTVTGSHDLTLHADALARLTEMDKTIAYSKGWTINGYIPTYLVFETTNSEQFETSDSEILQVREN